MIKIKEKEDKLKKEIDEKENIKNENSNFHLKIDELQKEIERLNNKININKPPLIGLKNIGEKYFMNPTLQCLSQTKNLTKYFLDNKNEN